jgi:hypothetical protein
MNFSGDITKRLVMSHQGTCAPAPPGPRCLIYAGSLPACPAPGMAAMKLPLRPGLALGGHVNDRPAARGAADQR